MAERRQHLSCLRLLGALGLTLTLALTAAACASDGGAGEPDTEGCADWPACETSVPTTSPTTATPVSIQLRPVLAQNAPPESGRPCPASSGATTPDAIVVTPGCTDGTIDAIYSLAPVELDGSAFESARAVVSQGGWVVNPVLEQGATGVERFNAIAAHCYAHDETCPTGQLAIVVDGVVISAPAIQQPRFEADAIQISGGFSEAQATALAAAIDAAA